jgi:hypothetical protein
MSRTILGSLVGALAVTALAAPLAHAAGRPANVTVRVEGASSALSYAPVTTTAQPVVKDGYSSHACSGTSAAGALELATDGGWKASYARGLGYYVSAIDGVRPASAADYWSLWVNRRSSSTGLCDTELQSGDEVLLFVCRSGPDYNCTNAPLGLIAPRTRGVRQSLRVVTYAPDGSTTPARGATVTGATRPVRTDAQGRATVTLSGEESRLRATRAGDVPSAPVFCAANACGSRDRTPPRVAVANVRERQVFSAAKAPRVLRGTALGLGGGIVELRLARRHRGTCTAFVGRIDDFVRCPRPGAPWFQAADRARWSYLLPRRLGPGRYTLGVLASDDSGNIAKRTVRFTVSAAAVAAGAAAGPGAAAPAHAAAATAEAGPAAPARAAAAPRVALRVVAAGGRTLVRRSVTASATTVAVGRKRCGVASGTPLAALLAARGPAVKVADYGSCSRRVSDGGGLYVTQVGGDRRKGQAGWVYSVDGRIGTAGAADPSGPFGSGTLRRGQRVVWFWCKQANACEKSVP